MSFLSRLTEVPGWMVVNAARYAMTRQTYASSETAKWLVSNTAALDEHTRAQIVKDITSELERVSLVNTDSA